MENRTNIASLKAARKFGPGYFIREQMELREWTQDDLSKVSGLSVKHLNQVLQDKVPLSIDLARIFAEIFNTSAAYWLNLSTSYRLWLAKDKTPQEKEADTKALIYERMPIKDMFAKGWLRPVYSADELVTEVLKFWNWSSLDFSILDKHYLPYLTRKSKTYNQFNASYAITWYRKAQLIAEKLERKPYNRKKLEAVFDQIATYSQQENGCNLFIEALAETGVLFFVLPHLQKTYLDGAAFLSGENPVVVYTGLHKRVDNFWFTVAHEIAHILLHLDEKNPFVIDRLSVDEKDKMEKEANELAATKLKHPEISNRLHAYAHYLPPAKVEECAADYQVHPAIVVGKMAHDYKSNYKLLTRYSENVLPLIESKYQFT